MGKPKIRFKGYEDDWEQRKLNEIADKVSEKNKNNEFSEPFTNSAEQGIISQKDYFDREIVNNENLDGYYIVRNDDFIYNPRISVTAPVGPINRNRLGRNGVMSPLYTVFRTHDIDNLYLEFYFKTTKWHCFMKLNGDSGARFDRFTISSTQFMKMPIPYPTLEEQRKIGKYFDSLDHLITLHQRKCEETKSLKKYMLQKMFPENGKCVPKIRFSGFSDDWEQCKVSEIGNIVTGSTPKTSISDNYGGEFLFVSPADIQENRYVDETITTLTKKGFDQGRKIREKASLFVSIGSTIGKVAQTSQESTTNQQINAVEPYDNFDDDFIFTSLENISGSIKAIASNQAVPIVNKTTFGETEIKVPSELAEQQKIGAYFRNLDHLITLHQHKCDELQKLKKFMLQNMFM